MRDIARAAGVSVSAVSLALRNSPKVSPTLRDTIQRIADQLGYRRDPRITELMEHLRTSRAQRSASTIAMLIPELNKDELDSYPPLQRLIEGATEVADMAGFNLDLFFLATPGMSLKRVRQILLSRGIKGVLIAPFASGVARIDFDCSGFCVATAGYSITEPRLHRACPNYLQMMDELIAACEERGYGRIGLVMTYGEGGIGQKLFTSSFLYWQTKIPAERRLPVLPKESVTPEKLRKWFERYQPDVIISAGSVHSMLRAIGLEIPYDVAFASIDVSQQPTDASGADHRYQLVGGEAIKQVLTMLNLNLTGLPDSPKVVLVDSHWRDGSTLLPKRAASKTAKKRASALPEAHPTFRGFID